MAEISAFLHETFAGNKIVKAFGMEAYEKKRFAERNADYFKLELKEAFIKSLSSPVMEILGGIGIAFIIWYGGSRVINGDYTAGTFISFLAAVIMLYDPVKKISRLNNSIQEGLAATDRIFDIIELESDIREQSQPVTIEHRPHRVSFNHVFFRYGDTPVLKDINLDVQPGEIIALVGTSGGGKTSLVNLIPRFFDVWQGAVFIDAIDVRTASIVSLRRQIAIVTQEPILFHGSIRDNIAYGNAEATDAQIREAAEAAYALDFIEKLPEGFETNIGELGTRLSGGERQRMCIARALLKDAPILILDEATSSLDTESETVVQKALENLMKGRTTFVIAHRLTTIANAHRIIVLADGKIVEEGDHQYLLAQKGEYAKLYYQQFNHDEMNRQATHSPAAISMDTP
jgi:subfamily B ATP-binding cassette protein MsbA